MSKLRQKKQLNKTALVLAHFGTTVPEALSSLDRVRTTIKKAFPHLQLSISFTSNIIRNIWAERRAEEQSWLQRGVARDNLYTKGILGTIGELQDQGYRTILVQPTHIVHGEQYEDLKSYVSGLQQISTIKKRWMPFEKIVCGRPILGTHGIDFDYRKDIQEVVKSLECDVELARKNSASLVYVGHGNESFSTGVYLEAQQELRQQYPDLLTFIGVVEGFPELGDISGEIKRESKKNIILKPFMLTAGDHAIKDIAGSDEESWKSRLEKMGFKVIPILEGLGSNQKFADIFSKRVQQTADLHCINLNKED
jgi:sirohydrochlorin cobaltochelatase